ncbi:MAG: hypothetical protein ACJ75J_13385, partial [Cytophagaceae bacterium]
MNKAAALFVAFLIFFNSTLLAQPADLKVYDSPISDKTVSFYELINEVVNLQRNTSIRNVKVRWNEETDRAYMDGRFLSKTEPPVWQVKHSIKFENCEFDSDYWLVLRNIQFMDYLAFFHCTGIKIIWNGCRFDDNM